MFVYTHILKRKKCKVKDSDGTIIIVDWPNLLHTHTDRSTDYLCDIHSYKRIVWWYLDHGIIAMGQHYMLLDNFHSHLHSMCLCM